MVSWAFSSATTRRLEGEGGFDVVFYFGYVGACEEEGHEEEEEDGPGVESVDYGD